MVLFVTGVADGELWYYFLMKNPESGIPGQSSVTQESKREIFPVGHTFTIEGEETTYTVEKVEMASEVGKQFGLKINREVPIYWIKGMSPGRQGGYHLKTDAVFMLLTGPRIFYNLTLAETVTYF